MSKDKQPGTPNDANQSDAPSTDTAESGTTHESTITDSLRNQWLSIVAEFDRNLPAFDAYVTEARKRIECSHGRWTGGTDHLRTFIRDGRFVKSDGSTFKVGHSKTAVWCREICRRWPDLAPHITLRPSKFDRFYLEA